VKDVPAETRLMEAIKKVKRGSTIYTVKFKAYDGLVIYDYNFRANLDEILSNVLGGIK